MSGAQVTAPEDGGALDWPDESELAARASDDRLWHEYAATTVRMELPSGAVLLTPARERGDRQPPAGPLHVVSACDPGSRGERRHDAVRTSLLQVALDGCLTYQAVGASADGRHAEDSLAVAGLTDEHARALGRRFGQVAVFAWSGATWSVLACATNRRTDLGWWAHRPPVE